MNPPNTIHWNTGNLYSSEGQRISAVWCPETHAIGFCDHDRMIDGWLGDGSSVNGGKTTLTTWSERPSDLTIRSQVTKRYVNGYSVVGPFRHKSTIVDLRDLRWEVAGK
jgi:hypothetical protein